MKATLIHCYSDHNRGDTGIIYSIYDLAKNSNPDLYISAMSVFSSEDDRFVTDHNHTKEVIAELYPSFFPEPGVEKKGTAPTAMDKLKVFAKYAIINLAIYITKSRGLARILFSPAEYASFENFISSDKVISKGGSFLYSFKGFKGAFFFARMIYPFYLARRFNIDSYIYSQSVGPFENKTSRMLFNKIQPHITGIFLREEKCLKYFKIKTSNVEIISDSAFSLNAPVLKKEESPQKNVAITARPHDFKNKNQEKNYVNALSALIQRLIDSNYNVYLIPQVTGPSKGEDDREILNVLYNKADKKEQVFYPSQNLNPREMKSLYGKMDYLIGTRLHSVIFALGMGVPCINIAYHGTKAEGIMGALGLEDYVLNIESITEESLISKFNQLQENNEKIKPLIEQRLKGIQNELELSMGKVLLESYSCGA